MLKLLQFGAKVVHKKQHHRFQPQYIQSVASTWTNSGQTRFICSCLEERKLSSRFFSKFEINITRKDVLRRHRHFHGTSGIILFIKIQQSSRLHQVGFQARFWEQYHSMATNMEGKSVRKMDTICHHLHDTQQPRIKYPELSIAPSNFFSLHHRLVSMQSVGGWKKRYIIK